MQLFTVGKVGVTLDSIVHKLEKRKSGDVKVLELKCRIAPFTAQHAAAMAGDVKPALFRLTNAEPRSSVGELVFFVPPAVPVVRQNITVYATPDTDKPKIRLGGVRITRIRARTTKGAQGYVLTFSATFSEDEKQLIYCNAWRTNMAFLSFEAAEPGLDYLDEPEAGDDDGEGEPDGPTRPAPMFEDPRDDEPPAESPDRANRKPISHARGKKGR